MNYEDFTIIPNLWQLLKSHIGIIGRREENEAGVKQGHFLSFFTSGKNGGEHFVRLLLLIPFFFVALGAIVLYAAWMWFRYALYAVQVLVSNARLARVHAKIALLVCAGLSIVIGIIVASTLGQQSPVLALVAGTVVAFSLLMNAALLWLVKVGLPDVGHVVLVVSLNEWNDYKNNPQNRSKLTAEERKRIAEQHKKKRQQNKDQRSAAQREALANHPDYDGNSEQATSPETSPETKTEPEKTPPPTADNKPAGEYKISFGKIRRDVDTGAVDVYNDE